MEQTLSCQRELLSVVHQCANVAPAERPTFGAVGRRLRTIQKQAARAGLAVVSPRWVICTLVSACSLSWWNCLPARLADCLPAWLPGWLADSACMSDPSCRDGSLLATPRTCVTEALSPRSPAVVPRRV